jgi:hypothetical protein
VANGDDAREFVRFIHVALSSFRRTLETPFEALLRQKETDSADVLREILRDLESARLSISPLRSTSGRNDQSQTPLYLSSLSRELVRLINNAQYGPVLRSLRFRRIEGSASRPDLLFPQFGKNQTAYEALESLIAMVTDFASPPVAGNMQRDLFQLRSIVPAQKIAPAQFEIRDQRLAVRKKSSNSREDDRQNIETARSELQQNGAKIIQELQQSNCDRRLLDNVQYLQNQLLDQTDAIKIGITNLSCEFMCSAFDHELPSAVSSLLKAHTRGVQLFVGQFPEWNKFLENAATAHLENSDVENLRSASENLLDHLKAQPNVVDAEVPRTLAYLIQLLENPTVTSKRAAFAVLRSMENLISLIFDYGAEFAQKTVSKTIDIGSTTASKIIVMTLLTIALNSATAISPVARKVPEMSWLQTASEIVKKQLEKMAAEK